MAGTVAINLPFGRALTAPVQADDLESSRRKLTCDFAVFFQKFGMAVQHHAYAAPHRAWWQRPTGGPQLALIGCEDRLRVKNRFH
jgi:hypothetical protein